MFLASSGVDELGRGFACEFGLELERGNEEFLFLLMALRDGLTGFLEVDLVFLANFGERVFFRKGAGLAASDVVSGKEGSAGGGIVGEDFAEGALRVWKSESHVKTIGPRLAPGPRSILETQKFQLSFVRKSVKLHLIMSWRMDWVLLATGLISLGLTMVQKGRADLLEAFGRRRGWFGLDFGGRERVGGASLSPGGLCGTALLEGCDADLEVNEGEKGGEIEVLGRAVMC